MADDVIAKIKERVDIVELISGYLKLTKAGINYKARCPFHNEKTGSFFVSPERQIWHCFGCGAGGDAFGFVKQIEGVEFPEALRLLARKGGVELTPYTREQREFQSTKTRLYEICELAAKFFAKQLWQSAAGQPALAYLRGRGVTDQSIRQFRLGWAPDSWQALTDFLSKSYPTGEIAAAGLIIKSDKPSSGQSLGASRYYDRFRSRITFPIADLNGQVVGFSARIFGKEDGAGKYINTPQTPIYDKGRILYGLDQAKLVIRQANRCLLVEGNLDVVLSHQAGARHTVASSGTALTDGHLTIIKRYSDNLDLCFDSDAAGALASQRGVQLALTRGFNVGIVTTGDPMLKDPADYVAKHGVRWAETAVQARPFLAVFVEAAKREFDLATGLGKKLFAQKLLPWLAAVSSPVERAHWLAELAVLLKVKEEILRAELAALPPAAGLAPEPATPPPAAAPILPQRLSLVEESLLSLLVKRPELAEQLTAEQALFLSEPCRRLIKQLGELTDDDEAVVVGRLAAAADPGLKLSLDITYLKAQELWKEFEEPELAREFGKLLAQAKKHYVTAQLTRLEFDIKAAERNQDKTLLAALLTDFSKIAKELGN